MPITTSAGQVLVNDALPVRYRDYSRSLNKKGIADLLARVAADDPDEYGTVVKRLADAGRLAATISGGYSFDVPHLRQTAAGRAAAQSARASVARVLANSNLSPDERAAQIAGGLRGLIPDQTKAVYEEALAAGNPLANQVAAGARGNPSNLLGLIGAPLAYLDNRNRIIPRPVTNSYSQGLTPAQFWAATYGSRKGIVGTKISVADSGYAAKRLLRAAHQLVVTDDDEDEPYDERAPRGLPVDSSDLGSVGSLLARPVGPYPRDTVLTKKVLNAIAAKGVKRILVRSPTVGGPRHGGVSARAAGIDEFGRLPGRNSAVGPNAANALSEVISQMTLGSKHGGGAVTGKGDAVGGYKVLNTLLESPEQTAGGAAHAETDGKVTAIHDAPSGGLLVRIGTTDHHVPQGAETLVKVGDDVEAGDVLSSGIPNAGKVVRHKGVGEGRRYFMNEFGRALRASGANPDRRNLEMVARGVIDHVRLTDEYEGGFPDDVVPYREIEAKWQPRPGARAMNPASALGLYLEKPVLHYTIGTKIRPSVVRELKEFDVPEILTSDKPPPFEPEMVRAMDNLSYDPDWMVRMYGSGVTKSFTDSAHRGLSSDAAGVSFVPALAKRTGFATGRQVSPGTVPSYDAATDSPFIPPKVAFAPGASIYTGQHQTGDLAGAFSAPSVPGAIHAIDPEASAVLTGSSFGRPGEITGGSMNGSNGTIPPPEGAKTPTNWSTGAMVGGTLAAGGAGLTAGAMRRTKTPAANPYAAAVGPTPAASPTTITTTPTPASPTGSSGRPIARPVPTITPVTPPAAPPSLYSRVAAPFRAAGQAINALPGVAAAKTVGGFLGRKVLPVADIAIEAANTGSVYADGYAQGGMAGAMEAGRAKAMDRFGPLQRAGDQGHYGDAALSTMDLVTNLPANVNFIGHGLNEIEKARFEGTDHMIRGAIRGWTTGQAPDASGPYRNWGEALTATKTKPYALVGHAVDQGMALPQQAAAAASRAYDSPTGQAVRSLIPSMAPLRSFLARSPTLSLPARFLREYPRPGELRYHRAMSMTLRSVDSRAAAADLAKVAFGAGAIAKAKNLFAPAASAINGAVKARPKTVAAIAAPVAAIGPPAVAMGANAIVNPDLQARFNAASSDYTKQFTDFKAKNEALLAGTGADPSRGFLDRTTDFFLGRPELSTEVRQKLYDANAERMRAGTFGANAGKSLATAQSAAAALAAGGQRRGGVLSSVFGENTPYDPEAVQKFLAEYGDPSRIGRVTAPPSTYTPSPSMVSAYNYGRAYRPGSGVSYRPAGG